MPIPQHVQPTADDKQLRCPNDNSLMEKESAGAAAGERGIVTDRCNACGRLWLDDGELHRLLAADTATVKGADSGPFGRESGRAAVGGRVCPRDGTLLLEIKHPTRTDVLIEICPRCKGVLLDAGELRQLSRGAPEEAGSWLKKMQKIVRW